MVNLRRLIRVHLLSLCQQHHSELGGLELCVEFFGQVFGMSWIGETDFFVLGARVLREQVRSLQVDRLGIIKNCPHAFAGQHLLSFVSLLVCVLNQHLWFRSAHASIYAINYVVLKPPPVISTVITSSF